MANEIMKVFESEEFGKVRTLDVNGEPYFVGKDIATILGYSNPSKAIIDRIDDDDKLSSQFSNSGQAREMAIINESGLYSLVLSSKLPTAKKFKRWITSEVLPSIRKVGTYSIQQKPDSYMIDNPVERAKRWIEEYEEKKALEVKIDGQKPLVEFAEQIQASTDVIDMKSMAKLASKNGIKIGRNKLFDFLRKQSVLDSENIPYANYMDREWFEVIENTYVFSCSDETKITKTTLVRPKGQMGIVRMLKKYYL